MSDDFIPSGSYYIRNQGHYAGRSRIEPDNTHPKPVYCPTDDIELFQIQALPNGHYIIRARGAPTAVVNNAVFAILLSGKPFEEWVLRRLWTGQYIIETGSRKAGWIAGASDRSIHVGPLTPTKTIPPYYPPTQVWTIQALVD